MNKMTTSLVLGSVLAASTLMSGATMAAGALSGNVGIMSDYFFRGYDQGTSATANGGVDYDFGNGVAIGIWGADVTDGIEYDLYGSYSGEYQEFSYSVGYTTYNYTGEFDDTYAEFNLGGGFGPISVEYSAGTWDGFGTSEDYSFTGITGEFGGAYLTYGTWGKDFDGSYVEVGYGLEVGGFDVGAALISVDDDLSQIEQDTPADGNDAEISMVFTMGKSFDL
jgi:uncharacterized protein (TIGR02001 family)